MTRVSIVIPYSIGARPAFLKSAMLVLRPIAARALTIKNLLALFIAPEIAWGMAPAVFMMAKRRKKQMNHGIHHR